MGRNSLRGSTRISASGLSRRLKKRLKDLELARNFEISHGRLNDTHPSTHRLSTSLAGSPNNFRFLGRECRSFEISSNKDGLETRPSSQTNLCRPVPPHSRTSNIHSAHSGLQWKSKELYQPTDAGLGMPGPSYRDVSNFESGVLCRAIELRPDIHPIPSRDNLQDDVRISMNSHGSNFSELVRQLVKSHHVALAQQSRMNELILEILQDLKEVIASWTVGVKRKALADDEPKLVEGLDLSITSIDEMRKFNARLKKSAELRLKLKKELQLIGGTTPERMVSNCLRAIMDNTVAGLFTYYGRNGPDPKYSFISTEVNTIIKEVIQEKFPDYDNVYYSARVSRVLTTCKNPRLQKTSRKIVPLEPPTKRQRRDEAEE